MRVLLDDGSIFQRHNVILWTEKGRIYGVGLAGLGEHKGSIFKSRKAFDPLPPRMAREGTSVHR